MKRNTGWIIIADRNGQLGNRLIVFSHFIANALEKKYGVINPFFNEYGKYFECASDNAYDGLPVYSRCIPSPSWNFRLAVVLSKATGLLLRISNTSPWYRIIRLYNEHDRRNAPGYFYDLQGEDFSSALKKKFVFVQGWKFRSYADVEKYSDTLRRLFRLKDEYASRVHNHLATLRRKYDLIVGVHIRLGDYKTFENGKYYFSINEYKAFMEGLYSGIFSGRNVCFMICSNETIPGNAFGELPVASGPGHFVEDLYALAGCDFIIGPPSTFSHWAAFYGKKPLARITDKEMTIRQEDFKIPFTL